MVMCMNRRRQRDLCLLLSGLLIWFLSDSQQIRASAAEALALCARSVIPALFPFMVVSGLLVSLGFGEWIAPHLSGWMTPLFHLPGCASSAVLLGLVGGYPIGARTAAKLYRDGQLTAEETERLLTFCNNSNPVFLISVLGNGVFGDFRAGLWLWLIHVASALLTGICFRQSGKSTRRQIVTSHFPCRSISLAAALVTSVQSALTGMLSVCAFVVFFYVLVHPLKSIGGHLGAALVGSVELFSLTPLLAPDRFSFLLAAFCSGWGGVSVLCQTAAVLDDTDLHLGPCLRGKALQGLFSLLLAALVVFLF